MSKSARIRKFIRSMSGDLLKLTEMGRGREVPVPAGVEVELVLPENPTTGLRWTLPDSASLEVISDTYAPADGVAPGAASLRVLRLRLTGERAAIRLERRQAWEPDVAPEATFEITLVPGS